MSKKGRGRGESPPNRGLFVTVNMILRMMHLLEGQVPRLLAFWMNPDDDSEWNEVLTSLLDQAKQLKGNYHYVHSRDDLLRLIDDRTLYGLGIFSSPQISVPCQRDLLTNQYDVRRRFRFLIRVTCDPAELMIRPGQQPSKERPLLPTFRQEVQTVRWPMLHQRVPKDLVLLFEKGMRAFNPQVTLTDEGRSLLLHRAQQPLSSPDSLKHFSGSNLIIELGEECARRQAHESQKLISDKHILQVLEADRPSGEVCRLTESNVISTVASE